MSDVDKVIMVGMYSDIAVDNWYMDNIDGREVIGWDKFVELLMSRFVSVQSDNLIGEFNKMKQTSTLDEYVCNLMS